ncbi:hypothetical protein PAPYR_4066 [Paratrimastix pyriformis]|uniref:Ubiquitin-like domain-containing protein n=1 Tax=Paratrimastix pyriformis TaxID=342808 RepID=A0ABQ8ULA6_9EUKA|nr:hypothetical protein PAPYR_4066 [Paratrimastix pyriformis]
MGEVARLVLEVKGTRKQRVQFPRNAGFEELKSLIARVFAPEYPVNLSYLSDGDVFDIAGDDSLKGYLQENPLPPLKILLTSTPPMAATPTATLMPTNDDVNLGVSMLSSQPEPSAAPVATATGETPPGPVRPIPNEPPSAPPPERLSPLSMCTLRLEANGPPPRTIEIAPDQADSMPLEVFMGLLSSQFNGRAVAGAPEVIASSGAVTGRVVRAKSLHALLRASLVKPVVIRVQLMPLSPTIKAERKKLKKMKQKEQRHAAAEPPPQQAAAAAQVADAHQPETDAHQPEVSAPRPADAAIPFEKIRALAARLAAPADTLIMDPSTPGLLGKICSMARDDPRTISLLRQAGVPASLVRLLTEAAHLLFACQQPVLALLPFMTIESLSVDPKIRAAFGRAGVAVPVVSLLVDHPDMAAQRWLRDSSRPLQLLLAHPDLCTTHPVVAEGLLQAIANLALHPANSISFERAGVVPPLVGLLTAHPNLPTVTPNLARNLLAAIGGRRTSLPTASPAVTKVLFGAITLLSGAEKSRDSFGQAGVVAPLVRMLTAHPDLPTTNSALAAVLLSTVRILSPGPGNRALFLSAGVANPLVRVLIACTGLSTATDHCLGAIRNLSVAQEGCAAFGRAGVVAPIVGLLTAHPDLPTASLTVAIDLLLVICNLSKDREVNASLGSAGIVAPLSRMLSHPQLAAISGPLFSAIGILAELPENWTAFVHAGVPAHLVRLLPSLPITNTNMANALLRLVLTLSFDPQCEAILKNAPLRRFVEFPGVDPMLVFVFAPYFALSMQ